MAKPAGAHVNDAVAIVCALFAKLDSNKNYMVPTKFLF